MGDTEDDHTSDDSPQRESSPPGSPIQGEEEENVNNQTTEESAEVAQQDGTKRKAEDDSNNMQPKKKLFCLPETKSRGLQWELPVELAQFLHEQCSNYMAEKDLEPFLICGTPSNMNKPYKMDCFVKGLLEKKGQFKHLTIDEELQKVQERIKQ